MYAIQVDSELWIVGAWKGWLMLSQARAMAMLFQTERAAAEALHSYSQLNQKHHYQVQRISLFPDSAVHLSK